eukprot:COSAG02_NODE_37651_length_439_cov_0.758824_1_plen_48_part_10
MLSTICTRGKRAAVALCSMIVPHIEVDAAAPRVRAEDAPPSNKQPATT